MSFLPLLGCSPSFGRGERKVKPVPGQGSVPKPPEGAGGCSGYLGRAESQQGSTSVHFAPPNASLVPCSEVWQVLAGQLGDTH